jgi:hypothetical protein
VVAAAVETVAVAVPPIDTAVLGMEQLGKYAAPEGELVSTQVSVTVPE